MKLGNVSVGIVLVLAFASLAQAQATRTWVSGVGDDVNPCSRTAPCKTFAGAISKTASPGEIDCLDPGGFGAVTITKSITIDGTTGAGFGSILSSGVQGVIINALTTDVIHLKNLAINGSGTTLGTNGINYIQADTVSVENCRIFRYSGSGITMTGANVGRLIVRNTNISDCAGNGILIAGTSAIANAISI